MMIKEKKFKGGNRMMTKKAYVPPMAEQNRYAEDVILSSQYDCTTQDKAWGAWDEQGGEL